VQDLPNRPNGLKADTRSKAARSIELLETGGTAPCLDAIIEGGHDTTLADDAHGPGTLLRLPQMQRHGQSSIEP
jgi:hypothetical protein